MVFPNEQEVAYEINYTLFDALSEGNYESLEDMIEELLKNGIDSFYRMLRSLPPEMQDLVIKIGIEIFEHHPLSLDGPCMVISDNGEGILDSHIDRLKGLGRKEEDRLVTTGKTDAFGIGRLAALSMLRNRKDPYYLLSATSARGPVTLFTFPRPSSKGPAGFRMREISADDPCLMGRRPPHSFAWVVLPNVKPELLDLDFVRQAVSLIMPRRPIGNELELLVQGQRVYPPALPEKEICSADGSIVGNFEKLDEDNADTTWSGVVICDASSGMSVDVCSNMQSKVPWPFSVSTLRGVIFIPDLSNKQDTSRVQLSKMFLKSAQWTAIYNVLAAEFSPLLVKLIGADIEDLDTLLGKVTKNLTSTFDATWGKPGEHTAPSGQSRPDGWQDKLPKKKGTTRRPPGEKETGSWPRPLGRFIRFEGSDIYLTAVCLQPHQPAQVKKEDGYLIVNLNSRDPLISFYTTTHRNQLGLEMYVVRTIVEALQATWWPESPTKIRTNTQKAQIAYAANRKR